MGRRCYVLFRRRYDVPIRRRREAPLRRLDNVPSRRRWVFHLKRTCDVAGTYRESYDVDTTSYCRVGSYLLKFDGNPLAKNLKFSLFRVYFNNTLI